MARITRVVAEGMPHHITQRGNRRQKTFFSDEDYAVTRGVKGKQKQGKRRSQLESKTELPISFFHRILPISSFGGEKERYRSQKYLFLR